MKAKILISLIVSVIVLISGCTILKGTQFEDGMQKIELIGAKYGVTTENVVPIKDTMYGNYTKELIEYREQLKNENQLNDVKALNLIIDIKLDLVEMQKNINSGLKALSTMNCNTGLTEFAKAKKKARIIKQKIQLMENSYKIQARKINGFTESVKDIANAVIEVEETIKGICA